MNKITNIKGIYPAKRKDGTLVEGNSPKTGKKWVMYSIVDKDDVKYGCFESQLTAEIKDGAEVFIDYETVKNGDYKNNNIKKITAIQKTVNIENPEPTGTKSQSEGKYPPEAEIEAIKAELKAVKARVSRLEDSQEPNEIKSEDLPF